MKPVSVTGSYFPPFIHSEAKEMQNDFLELSYISGSRSHDPGQIKCARGFFLQVLKSPVQKYKIVLLPLRKEFLLTQGDSSPIEMQLYILRFFCF